MNLQEIEAYLQEMGKILPRHLKSLGLPDRPLRLLAFGGVFMTHMHYRSTTYDIDIQFLDFLSIAEERHSYAHARIYARGSRSRTHI